MEVTESGIVISFNEEQPKKAQQSMRVTESGIVMVSNEEGKRQEIFLIVLGNTTSLVCELKICSYTFELPFFLLSKYISASLYLSRAVTVYSTPLYLTLIGMTHLSEEFVACISATSFWDSSMIL